MSDEAAFDYRPMGFSVNPFVTVQDASQFVWLRQHAWSGGAKLFNTVVSEADRERRRTILVKSRADLPDTYAREAENRFLEMTAMPSTESLLALNVPLDMMRLGKIRGSVAEMAELIAAVDFEVTLAAMCAELLATADESLTTWGDFASFGSDYPVRLIQEFETAPVTTVLRVFGKAIPGEDGREQTDIAIREAFLRGSNLDPEPDEADDSDEDNPDDQIGMGYPGFKEELEAVGEEEDEAPAILDQDEVARNYLVELIRARISPVVARAVNAYEQDGTDSVAAELRVTRAPKKTLRALTRLAKARWGRVAVLYDRLDPYRSLEVDQQSAVLSNLTELRWTLSQDAVFGLIMVDGFAPEIEEQFGGGVTVTWDFPRAEDFYSEPPAYDSQIVSDWLDAAAIDGVSPIAEDDPMIRDIAEKADMSLDRFVVAAAKAFENAAFRGLARLDQEAVDSAFVQDSEK